MQELLFRCNTTGRASLWSLIEGKQSHCFPSSRPKGSFQDVNQGGDSAVQHNQNNMDGWLKQHIFLSPSSEA